MRACRHPRGATWLGLVVLATALLGCAAFAQSAPAVATDRADYFPGDTVLIAGTGFHAGEQVTLQVVHIDGTPNTGDGHLPWLVTTDESGCFESFWFVPYDDSAGSAFKLTADCPDGLHAETTFTDGQPHWVEFKTSGLPSGVSITVDYTYTNPGGEGKTGSITFTSPGPSSSQVSTKPGTSFSYTFPATVTVNGVAYSFKSGLPASPFTTGGSGLTTTVTGKYEAAPTNRPPSVAVDHESVTVNEGTEATNTGTWSDVDGDTVTLSASVGDVTLKSDGTWSWSWTPTDGPTDSQTVKITATDEHGATGSATFDLTVNNVAPTVTAPSDQTADEGTAKSFDLGSFSDPGVNDKPWDVDVNWGDGSAHTTFSSDTQGSLGSQSHTYADNGTYTVTVKVTDKDGGSGSATFDVVVANVAPTVGAITVTPTPPVPVNTAVDASAGFTDPGTLDTHTAKWDWGDGTTSVGTVTESSGSGTAAGTHTYTTPGIYTVTLTVTDKDGGSDTEVYQYVVVYDPYGGFVTGGGWIISPAGAYVPDPSLTGKANFGFVSKYQKGATVPVGQTEFQFKVANLNFHSTSYEWLVVAGSKAIYKGEGTINGVGGYGFMLSAIDGDSSGAKKPDTFRIKIWDKATGAVVYDNQMGAAQDADPTTVLAGGSIVVHK